MYNPYIIGIIVLITLLSMAIIFLKMQSLKTKLKCKLGTFIGVLTILSFGLICFIEFVSFDFIKQILKESSDMRLYTYMTIFGIYLVFTQITEDLLLNVDSVSYKLKKFFLKEIDL